MKPFGLSQMKILEGMTPDEIESIRRFCEEVFYPFDTLLAFDGEEAKYVFLLRKGRTELVARHPKTGQKIVIAKKEPGETMGFSSLIQPYQMDFTIRCLEDCHLYRIPGPVLSRNSGGTRSSSRRFGTASRSTSSRIWRRPWRDCRNRTRGAGTLRRRIWGPRGRKKETSCSHTRAQATWTLKRTKECEGPDRVGSEQEGDTMGTYLRKQADFVVVGSGPGGATAARQLAEAGKKVLLLERGKDHRGTWYYGTHLGCLLYCDKMGMLMTQEGLQIVRGIMTGGSTNLFCGCASPPPSWLKNRYKINLDSFVRQTVEELEIAPLPRALWGRATQRVEEAARELGYAWEPQPKFMKVSRGEPFDCGAKCMLGCRCGAKWTAAEYVDQAVQAGCEILEGMTVTEVLVSGGKAQGVVAKVSGGKGVLRVEAPTVILAAGGIGSPIILQHSGVPEAGRGMTMDTTVMVCGESRSEGMHMDPPMAVSYCDDENGYMLSTLIDPWLLYPLIHAWHGPRNPLRFLRYGKTLGIMIKLKDEISGGISVEGKISKPMTDRDRWRLNHASNVARKILIRAGCKPDSVFVGPLRGTHPSGTVRIGEILSSRLESPIQGLYVSDASCFPEALDRPTVLTLIALSKRLAKDLLEKDKANARPGPKTSADKAPRKRKKKSADGAKPPPGEEPSEDASV